jgi:hypothetical protein
MSAKVIQFPGRHGAINCRRCGSILEDGSHDCDASLEAVRQQLIANGWTADDPDLPAHLRQLLRDGLPRDPPPEAA